MKKGWKDAACERVCQNEIMDEKTLPVVPSSWEEGQHIGAVNNLAQSHIIMSKTVSKCDPY